MNHYQWLESNLQTFLDNIEIKNPYPIDGLLVCDGDKCYGYRQEWEEHNIPFPHGVALYLLCSTFKPYTEEVRNTKNGWVSPSEWVIRNYHKFKEHLPKYEYEKTD